MGSDMWKVTNCCCYLSQAKKFRYPRPASEPSSPSASRSATPQPSDDEGDPSGHSEEDEEFEIQEMERAGEPWTAGGTGDKLRTTDWWGTEVTRETHT